MNSTEFYKIKVGGKNTNPRKAARFSEQFHCSETEVWIQINILNLGEILGCSGKVKVRKSHFVSASPCTHGNVSLEETPSIQPKFSFRCIKHYGPPIKTDEACYNNR